MARRYGIETADITLYPLGGVARLTDRSEGGGLGAGPPEQELWIALAGPAVNVVIAFAMGLVQLVVPFDPHTFAGEMAGFVLFGNIALVMFNMLPFFPMDGGRVFRAWLAMQIGQLRATEAATTLGFFMALGLAVLGACSGNLMLVLISGVIYLLGRQELAVLRVRQGQEQAAMAAHQVRTLAVDASARPPSADFSGFTFDQRHRMWVYWQGGRPIQGYALE
jgi:stage IV sporulation protein FB